MPEQTIGVRTLNAMLRIPLDQRLQKPLLVTPLDGDGWQILDGHRRHAAARQLGLPHLDAILRRDHGPAHRLQQQLAIHTQAAAFDPIAEAQALHVLMWQHNLDRGDIARAVGKSPGWVRDRVLLLQLEPAERDLVRAGRMPPGAALSTIRATCRCGERTQDTP